MPRRNYDVFLSYNSSDRDSIELLAKKLVDNGIHPWWDQWELTPGSSWQDEIVQGLLASQACAIIVGPSGMSDWAREELGVAQDQAAKDRAFRIFMVLLPGAPELTDPRLAFLRTRTWVDLRDGIADPEGIQDLISAITGAPRRRTLPVATPDTCPYRGLEPFEEEHAKFFYGRDEDIAVALGKLSASRFLAVLGPSGSGKSSLLRAGLVPSLRWGALPGSEQWPIRVLTPGLRPLRNLVASLATLFPETAPHRTLDHLREDERSLDLAASVALAERPPAQRLVLVIDQFEELFTLCEDEEERTLFVANLVHAATIPGGRLMVVVGMRADFYHRAASYPKLRAVMADQQLLVGPMGAQELRRVIEEPARSVDLDLEAGLVETIMADVADRPGTLPLLEHVLLELWRRRRGTMLTLEAYVACGGVSGSLAKRANAVYSSLTPRQQSIARRVLLRLVAPGEQTEDTRRRASVAELLTRPQEESDVEAVITALADQRLITVGHDHVVGSRVVELTHEALIRGWPELRGWIDDDREVLQARNRLTEAAIEWDRCARDEELLYRGARLALWQERDVHLNDLERAFLAASHAREEGERATARRRVRTTVGALAIALLAISGVAVVAVVMGNRAANERATARSRQLATSAGAELGIDPERSVLLALRAFEAKETPEAESALRQAVLQSQIRTTLRGHEEPVEAAAFSPDGRLAVSASDDATVRVWDVAAGREQAVLKGHDGPVFSVAFHPNGRLVASAGIDGSVRVWDVAAGREEMALLGHEGAAYGVAFSPDGRFVVSGGEDTTVRVWDMAARRERTVLRGHRAPSWGVAFSPDGARLASASDDTTVRVWDLDGGQPMVLQGHQGPVQAASFSPDSRFVVTASVDATVQIWDLREKADPVVLRGHEGQINSAAFGPDGHRIVSAGGDGSVRIWDLRGPSDPIVLLGHVGAVTRAELNPDGTTVISSGADGSVRIWDSARPGERAVLEGHPGPVFATAFGSPNVMLTAGSDGSVRVWDPVTGDGRQLGAHPEQVRSAVLSDDGRHAASAGADGTVRVWDLAGTEPPVVLRGGKGAMWTAAFSPDGHWITGGGQDGTVLVWDWRTGHVGTVLGQHDGDVFSVAFSPDGTLVASGGRDGSLRLWDPAADRPARALPGHDRSIFHVGFSPDGRTVLTASDDATIRFWDVGGDRLSTVLRGHRGPVRQADFSPDGRLVVSAGSDATVRVWDVRGDRPPLVLRGHEGPVLSVVFGPDGTTVASGGSDATVRVWSCDVCGEIDEVVELARTRVTRALTPEERAAFLNEPVNR